MQAQIELTHYLLLQDWIRKSIKKKVRRFLSNIDYQSASWHNMSMEQVQMLITDIIFDVVGR